MRHLLTLVTLVSAFMAHADPINIGSTKQLFIDNRFIAASENITLRANPAQKLGPLKNPDGSKIHETICARCPDES